MRAAVENGTNFEEELGDVLFAAVKVGRFCGVDPEAALSKTCEKFIARFRKGEETVNARGEDMSALPLDELMALLGWPSGRRASAFLPAARHAHRAVERGQASSMIEGHPAFCHISPEHTPFRINKLGGSIDEQD